MNTIGSYIREQVIPEGMSVTDAAHKLGVGRPALSNLLNGRAKLSRDMALKLERAFGANVEALLHLQSELVGGGGLVSAPSTSNNSRNSGFFRITSLEIEAWAESISARTTLPVLIRRLICLDVENTAKVEFLGYDSGERQGWDGFTETVKAGRRVPAGKTGWELSNSNDLPAKPNRDIQARLTLPRRERSNTNFIFVTGQRWPGKTDWAKRQRAQQAWREVRAYDADDIEQWLEESASAQIWFMRELGRDTQGLQPLSESWRSWCEATSPRLSPMLFDDMLSVHRASVVDWVEQPISQPLIVVADSTAEALAFLSLALRDHDGNETADSDRAILITSPDAVQKICNVMTDALLVVADHETEMAIGSFIHRHHLIIVRPRASGDRVDIALEGPSRETFDKALIEMSLDEVSRDRLRYESGLSLTIMRRRLAEAPALRRPDWAQNKALQRKLMPMLLAGAWNRSVEADRMLLQELAGGKSVDDVEQDLVELITLDDTPIWATDNYRGVISRKDALFTAGTSLTQADLDRFFEVAEFILSEDDPALDLPPEDRWKSNIFGKKREISGPMRDAVGEMLVLLSVYGDQVLGPQINSVTIRVNTLVSRLLRNRPARNWLSQEADLPLLAEASPRAFLEAIQADLSSQKPQLLDMLRPAGSGPFDSPSRSGLLWALELLAWDPDYLFSVARILGRLSEVTIDDNWANRPDESLGSFVRAWWPQTGADIEQRIKLLDLLAREFPTAAWKICKAQIDTGQDFASLNHRPRWRTLEFGAFRTSPELQDGEEFRMRRHALDLMLGWPSIDMIQLGDLIEASADLPTNDQRKIWERVQAWIDSGVSDYERASLRERMRRSVLSRRNRPKTKLSKVEKLRKAVFDNLAPADPVDRHRWLFAQQWVAESGDDLWDDGFDYEKHTAHIQTMRRSAMVEIKEAGGLDAIGRLLESVEAWWLVGGMLCETTPPAERPDLIQSIFARGRSSAERSWGACLEGALQALDQTERDAILRTMIANLSDGETLVLFKSAPFNNQTWQLLGELRSDLEPIYWREIQAAAWQHSEAEINFMVERLLDAERAISAFNAVSFAFGRLDGTILSRLMKALLRPSPELNEAEKLNAVRVSDALDVLEAGGHWSQAELARFEYVFISALSNSRHRIPNLEKQIEASPADFIHLICARYRREDDGADPPELRIPENVDKPALVNQTYRVLSMLKRIPGTRLDGTVDPTALMVWLSNVRDRLKQVGRAEAGDGQIGELLGRCMPGADDIWPNEAVREALEVHGSDALLVGMQIGVFNSRGATWRVAGSMQERSLAERYKEFGRKLQAEYPTSARLLENIAEMYARQAASFDNEHTVRRRLLLS
ncbi:helix-turn-helix domain-containing protein [Iodidimonas sp. SYSU 1G8]|uniref:helix-turn-helix transcriptional regulator n=1 Tax=Iodidimonas sp. SYSU 1G8 TaxID=3133967 RepID=UPI0031FF37B6